MLCGHCIAAKHMSMGYDDKLRYLRKVGHPSSRSFV